MLDWLYRFLGYELDKDIVRKYVLKKIAEEAMEELNKKEIEIVNECNSFTLTTIENEHPKRNRKKRRRTRQQLKKKLALEKKLSYEL
tara:strand:+ start:2998 stop:3258 length:261 start_codon:yes stop_codon:yes gene_type:complete